MHPQYGEDRQSRKIAREIVGARQLGPIHTTRQLADIVVKAKGFPKDAVFRGGRPHPAIQTLRIFINDELNELRRGLHAAEHLLKPGGRCIVVTFHSLEDRIAKRFFKFASGTEKGLMVPDWQEWQQEKKDFFVGQQKKNPALKMAAALSEDAKSIEKETLRMKHHNKTRKVWKEQVTDMGSLFPEYGYEDEEEGSLPSFEILTKKTVEATYEEVTANPRSRSAKLRAAVRTAHPALSVI
ncbi:putative methyltransferase-like protein 15 [Rhizophlyctis rosea]|nr:putative methyltransferase-like protein 15 [Rhizophlyctis rosea]